MKCPLCNNENTRVIDSRPAEDGLSIRRRRECDACGRRFTTYEKVETIPLVVVKKDKEEETTRYYRVYNVVEKGENHIIFNTHAPGGNRHPAPDFWEFENILLKAIRDKYSIK